MCLERTWQLKFTTWRKQESRLHCLQGPELQCAVCVQAMHVCVVHVHGCAMHMCVHVHMCAVHVQMCTGALL